MAVAQNQLQVAQPPPQIGLLSRLVGAKTKFQTRKALWGYVLPCPGCWA